LDIKTLKIEREKVKIENNLRNTLKIRCRGKRTFE
jgi:hypothetical protein